MLSREEINKTLHDAMLKQFNKNTQELLKNLNT